MVSSQNFKLSDSSLNLVGSRIVDLSNNNCRLKVDKSDPVRLVIGRTLTVGGSITVQLVVSSLTGLDYTKQQENTLIFVR